MSWFWDLNLIRCLDIYLLLIFVIGTGLRVQQYRSLLGMIWSMHERWPHLVKLVKQHRGLFLTWGTILPALLMLLLLLGQLLASRLLWPHADVTIAQLLDWWLPALGICCLGGVMFALDCYGAWQIENWDRAGVEKQLDQAEHWLHSWTGPVVRVFTLGFINPRRQVGEEVRNALVKASAQLNTTLWWGSLPVTLRIAFGGSVWLTYLWVHH
jgi:hypothetical protein